MKRLVSKLKVFAIMGVVCTTAFAQKPDINWFANNSNANTFNIANADQLAGLAVLVNNTVGLGQAVDFKGKTIVLTDNIDLSKYGVNYNAKKGWIPIGINHETTFKGIFDGNGKTISGLYMNMSKEYSEYTGLFGFMDLYDKVEIKNVGLVNVNITGYSEVGAVVGVSYGGVITKCYSTGTIKGYEKVGGVAGKFSGKMVDCYSSATVIGVVSVDGRQGGVGGVVGEGRHLIGCYFTGKVSGSGSVGGVVGSGDGTIVNCYSIGAVNGNNYVGGIVGGGGNIIADCYSTGTVIGKNYVGGVAGTVSRITNCYSTGAVTGDNNVGGVVGYESWGSGSISNCAGLNPSVKAKGLDFGRIIGKGGKLSGNAAFVGMTNGAGNSLWINKTATEKNGLDIAADEIKADPTIGGRFTKRTVKLGDGYPDFTSGWVTEAGKLPGIGTAVDMPAHLK
jgi:hypothetical protein